MSVIANILLVAAGGSAGALTRFGISAWLSGRFQLQNWWGILAVNVLGCFLAGIVAGVAPNFQIPEHYRNLISIGFLGSLTTFSAFATDLFSLADSAGIVRSLAHLSLTVIFTILAFAAGMFLCRYISSLA